MRGWGRRASPQQVPQALLWGHSSHLGSPWGSACLGTIPASSQGAPAPAWPLHPPGSTVQTWQCWGLEASASEAGDPAELEQVGPIGQDLETARGVAPGTHAHGDLPSRLSQSCSPTTNRYCWLGAATVTTAAPRLRGRGSWGRTKSSGQLAGVLALLRNPSLSGPF